MTHTIEIQTESYNDRRYSKPWIARVDFASDKNGSYQFGDWIGRAGGEGTLEIDANTGDIIAQGQKDIRKPKNSTNEFYQVKADGSLEHIGDKGAAYKIWKKAQDAPLESPLASFSDEDILAEAKKRGLI